ncbi:MAG: hypothetical protein AB1551_03375 [Actinomycetota bacterium]
MRLAVRIALWVLLLGGSAAAGAFVAARSNPLSPQVGNDAPTSTQPAKPDRWLGTIRTTSFHQLYVGGTCESDWNTTLRLRVSEQGDVSGTGSARLTSESDPCPFDVAQLQIRRFKLSATGSMDGGNLRLWLSEVSHVPSAGAEDLGGFRETMLAGGKVSLLLVPLDGVEGTVGTARASISVQGPDRDTYGSTNVIRLRCTTC